VFRSVDVSYSNQQSIECDLREFEIAPLLLFGALIDRRLQQGVRAYVLKQYMAHQNNHIRHGFKHEN